MISSFFIFRKEFKFHLLNNIMRNLTDQELDVVSDLAVDAVEKFLFSRISKKEILDLHINVEISYDDVLDVDISVDIDIDPLSVVDATSIVEEAVDFALMKLDAFIGENYS